MEEQTFQVGAGALVQCNAPAGTHGVFFEDDGETGYFYAVDLARPSDVIVDAVHIYDVAKVVDRERPCTLSIVWSEDASKCALSIDRYPHAAFDFSEKRGYCRTNPPTSEI